MKKINELEAMMNGTSQYQDSKEAGISYSTYKAYKHSRESECKRLDFADICMMDEIGQIVADLRRLGIKEFSVSEQSTALMRILAGFEAAGCKVTKMTTAKATYIELGADDYADVPAIKLLVK